MKKEDLLAMGLTEEQADKVMDGLNGDFVTKSRFNEVNTELKAARTALSERDKQLEELKKVDAAALQAQITQLQADNKQKDADYVDGIMDYWADWFAEKLDVSYEGVHG